jgi:hypothetical protein
MFYVYAGYKEKLSVWMKATNSASVDMSMIALEKANLKDIDIKEVFVAIVLPLRVLELCRILTAFAARPRHHWGIIRLFSAPDQMLAVLTFFFVSIYSPPAVDLGLGGWSVLTVQQVAEQSARLFASGVFSNFKPWTLFELAKHSTRLVNHGYYVGNDNWFVCLTVSLRVSLNEHAGDHTEAMVSRMIVAVR